MEDLCDPFVFSLREVTLFGNSLCSLCIVSVLARQGQSFETLHSVGFSHLQEGLWMFGASSWVFREQLRRFRQLQSLRPPYASG